MMETVPAMPGSIELLVMLIPLITFIGIMGLCIVFPFWRIFTKAGFSGALSLLMFIPLVNIALVFFLAFSRWPSIDTVPPRQSNEGL